MATLLEVGQVVDVIGAAYPNFAPTKETINVYFELLKDIPADLLKTATLQCCAESGRKFAPSVGEIRGAASVLRIRAQGIPSALEAWDEVCTAEFRDIRPDRPYYIGGQVFTEDPNPHKWSHPIVERVAKMMGWPNFPGENESTDRAHFFKQYEIESTRFSEAELELPAVTRYLARARGEALPIGEVMKQLKEG